MIVGKKNKLGRDKRFIFKIGALDRILMLLVDQKLLNKLEKFK